MVIGQTNAEIWQFLIFKMAAVRNLVFVLYVWNTHKAYLVVIIAVQNLVGIGFVVLKIHDIQYFAQ